VRQGDVFLFRVRAPAPLASIAARFGRWEIGLWPEERGEAGVGAAHAGLAGVDVEDPAGPTPALVEARTAAGEALEAQAVIPVARAPFPTQRITVSRPFVELDTATLARVRRERQRMEGALAKPTLRRLWAGPFRPPLEGPPAPAGFGARRIINGEPRAPHTGADYAAPAGTPVLAAQAGEVVLAEDQFFAGRAVVIDHGLGLFTMYFHLEEVRVREGDAVRAGQAIGTVGASGRATGAHLHWGARLGGARIDPTALLRVAQQ
jgi:murein DD-endopeptidase MepM/ murein hydrolase activator NlpD